MHRFRPRLLDDLKRLTPAGLGRDIGAGVTVGVVALPLAMAFAIASGLPPEDGLTAAIVGGLLISLLGGSSVQIGGPAGAFIVVVYGIVERHGAAQLLVATFMAGAMLMLMGWLRLGALVRFIPVPIVIGFTNGIAVLIALSQIKELLGLHPPRHGADFLPQVQALVGHLDSVNPASLALGLLSLAIVAVWPKPYGMPMTAAPWSHRLRKAAAHVPGPLMALLSATALATLMALPVDTIGSRFGAIPSGLPMPQWPELDWTGLQTLLMPAVTLALLGAVESLLCARVADKLRPQEARHEPNQELMAQGAANLVSPLFGGMPVTGTVARTVTNVRAGAGTPVAGIVHALTLLAILWMAAPWAAHVPLPALAGLLMFVAWNMGEWREFSRLRQFSIPYRITLLGTFILTVTVDLTVAVEVGLLLACGFFIWRMGQLFEVRPGATGALQVPADVQVLSLFGALFFGAVGKVEQMADQVRPETHLLILDMHRLISMDNTGLEALMQLQVGLQRRGTGVVLVEVNPQPLALIHRSGFAATLGTANIVPTLEAALALGKRAAARPDATP